MLTSYITRAAKWLILFSMHCARLPLGNYTCCRYTVTCTHYAEIMLEEKPFFQALWLIIKRVSTCHPFYPSTKAARQPNG